MRVTFAHGILSHRPVRQLWLASAGTSVAVWSVTIAITIAVLAHHPVATLAWVGLAGALPALVLMPLAGIWADRYDVRTLSLWSMAGQCGATALLALVIEGNIFALAGLYAVQGTFAALWPPARQQWLYGLIEPDLRHQANSAIGSINGVMILLGAAFGGALSAGKPSWAVLAAVALQALVFLQIWRIPRVDRKPGAGARARGLLSDLADGVRAARRYPLARSVIWIGIAWGLIGGGYSVMLAGHFVKNLHVDAFGLGLVYAADGLTVILATVAAARLPRSRHLAVYGGAYVLQGIAWAMIFAAPAIPLAVAALVVMRFASGYIIALDTTILLETVPDEVRGRITSLHITTYNGVARISLATLGVVLALASVSAVGIAAGVASAVFGVVWWWRSGRSAVSLYRRMQAQPSADVP